MLLLINDKLFNNLNIINKDDIIFLKYVLSYLIKNKKIINVDEEINLLSKIYSLYISGTLNINIHLFTPEIQNIIKTLMNNNSKFNMQSTLSNQLIIEYI